MCVCVCVSKTGCGTAYVCGKPTKDVTSDFSFAKLYKKCDRHGYKGAGFKSRPCYMSEDVSLFTLDVA